MDKRRVSTLTGELVMPETSFSVGINCEVK